MIDLSRFGQILLAYAQQTLEKSNERGLQKEDRIACKAAAQVLSALGFALKELSETEGGLQ
jgi:hypothetical protein